MGSLIRLPHPAAMLLAATMVAAVGVVRPAYGADAGELLVVTSHHEGPYGSVVSGIRNTLRGTGHGLTVESLASAPEQVEAELRRLRKASKAPILTIGSVATRAALEAPGNAPVIACMVVDSPEIRRARNVTGVLLDFPLETQLRWVKRFSPQSHTIGVLYNPAENQKQIDSARRVAKRLGLNLLAREVHRPQDLPDALDALSRKADLLWGVTDQVVLSRQTAEAILLFSFRNRIPFSGLSASWVKAGALYALDRDYEDLGAQCAEMAVKVLNGRRVSSIPLATPRKLVYALNLRTAEHLKVELPPEIVDGAKQVFR